MADSTTSPFSIFRFLGDSDTEASIANNEAVGFQYGLNEQSSIGILGYKVIGDTRITDVPAPDQASTAKPDTGNVGPFFEVSFAANEKIADSVELARLWRFYLQRKAVRGVYARGRFGIRNDAKPYLDVTPINASGLKLVHLEMEDVLEFGGLVLGSMTFQLSGTNAQIITRINGTLGITGGGTT